MNLQKESYAFACIIRLLASSLIDEVKSGVGRAFPKAIRSKNPNYIPNYIIGPHNPRM
jgi:hypothetical protein